MSSNKSNWNRFEKKESLNLYYFSICSYSDDFRGENRNLGNLENLKNYKPLPAYYG